VCSWVLILPTLQKFKEFLRPPLLKDTHQRAPHSLHLRARNLGDLAITIDKAPGNLFELEVPYNISMDQDFRQFSIRDDKLRD
jgi:hypothetical protein